MWRHPVLKFVAIVYVVWGAWSGYRDRPVHPADGVLVSDDPVQTEGLQGPPRHQGRWRLTPRATYRITARILGVERYHFDALAALIPEDLALGWGPLSDSRVLKTMDITQSHRFYFWRASDRSHVSKEDIIAHSANTHVIPENPGVGRVLSRLRPGQVVELSGELVDAQRDDGLRIRTSMVRTDSGAGACEVMLVHDVRLAP